MARIGVVTLGVPGHLNPLSCLGPALQDAGYQVIFFQNLDHEEVVRRTGLGFAPVGEEFFREAECRSSMPGSAGLTGWQRCDLRFRFSLKEAGCSCVMVQEL